MMNRASRYLYLLSLLVCTSCVVPVGPDWVDPQGNVPPSIARANPPVGSALGSDAEAGGPLTVEVTLADQNAGDILSALWIVDYPPYVQGVSHIAMQHRLPDNNNSVERAPIAFAPICSDVSHGTGSHRLLLAVSDRDFVNVDDESRPDMPSSGYLLHASWTFTLHCQ